MGKPDVTNTKYTRRTHIVRIDMDATPDENGVVPPVPDGPSTATNYIDVEVLDAIAFRDDRNKEMILNFAGEKVVAYITDDTGGDHAKSPSASDATRRSHMKRIKKGDAMLDVEVIDAVAFRDVRGEEWILNMPDDGSVEVYNSTDDTGDDEATRRVHTELVSGDPTSTKPPTADFLTVIRNDNIAFRTIMGKEMVLVLPSNNDPNNSDKAAVTHTKPEGYDPTDPDGPVPPGNTDDNVYLAPIKDKAFFTNEEKIMQGPFWWIRSVSGGAVITVKLSYTIEGTATATTADMSIVANEFRSTNDLFNRTAVQYDVPINADDTVPPTTLSGGLARFFQFALVKPTNTHTPPHTTTTEIWVIDTAQWQYKSFFVSAPFTAESDFIAFLASLPIFAFNEPGIPDGQILTPEQIAVNVKLAPGISDPPDPSFFTVGAAHEDTETVTQVDTNKGDVTFYISVAPLRALQDASSDGFFRFSINSTALPGGHAGLGGGTAETSIGGKPPPNNVTNSAGGDFALGGGLDFKVDLKTLAVTVVVRSGPGGGAS